jgi:hypothetical protein
MPHIRPDCIEQSASRFPVEHRRKPNNIAVRLTRDVLLLRSTGSSRRAIAASLNLSQRRVQTILDGVAPALSTPRKPFVTRERDADYAAVKAELGRGSTMRAEHQRYATRCPAPYSFSYFWRRFEDWLDAQPDPQGTFNEKKDRLYRRRSFRDRPETETVEPPRGGSFGARGDPPRAHVTPSATLALPEATGGRLGFPSLPGATNDEVGGGRAAGFDGKITDKPRLRSESRVSLTKTVPATEDTRDEIGGGAPLEGGLLFISEPHTALQIRQGALCADS